MATFDASSLSPTARAQADAITTAIRGTQATPVRDVAAINSQRAQNVANGTSAYGNSIGGAIVEGNGAGGAVMADGTISSTGNINATAQGVDFSVPRSNVAKSTALAGGMTAQDLLNRRTELEQAVVNANTPSQTERDLTEQLNATKQLSRKAQLALNRETERLQTTPGLTQEIAANFTSDTARRFARTIGDLGVGASGIADALNAEVAKRTSAVSAAEGLLKADKDTLALIQDVQKMTNPNLIGSPQVNQVTGDVTVFRQDPQTGTITTEMVGNVGASKSFISTNFSTETDAQGNKVNVLYGINPNGTVTKQTLGIAEGSSTGVAVGTPGTKPVGKPDYVSSGFANRAVTSDAVINQIADKFTDPSNTFTRMLPNFLKGEERQKYEQAQRDFVNAVLRKESGAVISPEEFSNAQQQYFPQPGDKPGVIVQKAVNRVNALNSLIGASGSAYDGTFIDPKSVVDPLDIGVSSNPLNLDL
jgi:hypothetical protein